ncbi:MAG: DUF192 domain-containing protein [Comamonadaceae bacterium]|nr:MAG: DUF192 domain-containing protein [Comamonadaceae bacterium]
MNLQTLLRCCALAAAASFNLLAVGPAAAQTADPPQLDLPRVTLGAGMYRIDAQLARTPAQQQTGLMHRKEMPQQEGMLFEFDQPSIQCFWMKNTLLPLSAAFVADDGRIVNLVDMQPQTLDSHCSTEAVRFVLEMNQGWFAKKKIGKGFKLTGTPFSPTR